MKHLANCHTVGKKRNRVLRDCVGLMSLPSEPALLSLHICYSCPSSPEGKF